MIAQSTIDRVRDLPIEDVVRKYWPELKRAGASWSAKSPFADEKTPSFFVVPSKNIFKCFSTGKGGDAITFVIEKEGITYPDAIKLLCADFHIQLEYEQNGQSTPEQHDKQDLLLKINRATSRQYREQLMNLANQDSSTGILTVGLPPEGLHPATDELYHRRKFISDTIVQWQIGYAPGEVTEEYTPQKWKFLAEKLISSGHYEPGIELGLIKNKMGVTYDTFRHRIIYPIIDENGQYRGFGARALNKSERAKYINSSDSIIFNKSKILYGLHFAIKAIKEKGFANLMEGYTDVISFHQAEINNSVGTCGTALTDDQAKLLKRYTDKVVLFYDPDEAGQAAAARAIDVLMRFGFVANVVPMPSIITKKPDAPTEENPEPAPWSETVFVQHRDKEKLVCKHGTDIITIPHDQVTEIKKVDPDELVRMFV